MPSQLRNKRYLLTYSQVNNHVAFTVDTLADFLESFEPIFVEVVKEFHADGGTHYHAVIAFEQVKRGPMSTFDFLLHHPNIQPINYGAGNLRDTRAYLRKSLPAEPAEQADRWAERGEVPAYSEEAECYGWGRVLREATNQDEFCQLVKKHHPKEWVLRHHDILAFAQANYNSPSSYVAEFPRESYTVPQQMDDWVANVLGEVSYFLCPRHREPLF